MEALKNAREEHGFENAWSSKAKTLYSDVSEANKMKVYSDLTVHFMDQIVSCFNVFIIDLCF